MIICLLTNLPKEQLGLAVQFHLINLSTALDQDLESYGTISLLDKLLKYSIESSFFIYLAKS